MQQAAAAAVLGAAHDAVKSAVNNAFKPRPNWAFAMQSSAHMIALGFGSGLMRPAPGTWGTVFGWVTFNYLLAGLSSYTTGLTIAVAFAVGVWACGAAGKALGVIDHGAWVWDEVVAFWLVLWLIPTSFTAQIWAFVLFRFFDIVKPPPIRQFDAQMKNGFGVMWDDIVAAFYTLLVIAVWLRLFG
jgi:phosphatidylglycerophosphatase A